MHSTKTIHLRFNSVRNRHSINTRAAQTPNYTIPTFRNSSGKQTYVRRATVLWNQLPTSIRLLPEQAFKKQLKTLLDGHWTKYTLYCIVLLCLCMTSMWWLCACDLITYDDMTWPWNIVYLWTVTYNSLFLHWICIFMCIMYDINIIVWTLGRKACG